MPTDAAGVNANAVAAMGSDGNYANITAAGSAATTQIVGAIQDGIYQALISQGVDEETAVDDACRMEHVISDASFAAIKEHIRTKHALDV